MKNKNWIITIIIVFLTIPFFASIFTSDESRDLEENTRIQEEGFSKQHQIPRKQYHGAEAQGNQMEQTQKGQLKKVSGKVMDQVLAKDLAMTTSLYVEQLEEQLERWSKVSMGSEEALNQYKTELHRHKYIHSLGLIQDGKAILEKGTIDEQALKKLKDDTSEVYRSSPYMSEGKQMMLLGRKNEEGDWIVGEIDLSFIKGFVGSLASVADANGNFFISSDEKHEVKWNQKLAERDDVVSEAVPELDWRIVIYSKEEPDHQRIHYKNGQVFVQFTSEDTASEWIQEHPEFIIEKQYGELVLLSHTQLKTEELIQTLTQFPQVVQAEPNYIYNKQAQEILNNQAQVRFTQAQNDGAEVKKSPNDEFFMPYQWNLKEIFAEQGWGLSSGSTQITIAYLDTGIDIDHEDLKDKIDDGFNSFDKSTNIVDEHGHGTHVAGIIGALTNNVTGIAGTAWENRVLPVKALNENGEGSIFEIASGLIWATDHGAKVINLSLGDSEHSDLLYDAIRYAYERDVVLIAAAGNENVEEPMFPSAYDEVLAVSAVNEKLEKADFSNYGPHIDVAAPGENIPSTFIDDQYVFMSGTSMASPHVAGLAGLIRSFRPDLTNDEVMDVIRKTATDLGAPGHDPVFGHGLINIEKALQYLQNGKEILQEGVEQDIPEWGWPEWLRRIFQNDRH
ncbi:S8 family peptidase [Bacillus horti]|uniref:Subtilisin family serine protease n=1 Tax=Caldalkalibacillus horti TaxID=77523 RepID=A0ABT9W2A9_9BACI|nr:S8 family peptidase [Bacillus horti]MDQ0167366.1 subtilisin family serine protease [Bacillus horti]